MTKYQSWLYKFRSFLLGVIALGLGMAASAFTSPLYEQQEKVFERQKTFRPVPIEMVEIKTADKIVSFSENFSSGDEWLKGTTFRLKNNFDKEIVYFQLSLFFPETIATGNEMVFDMSQGHHSGMHEENIKRVPPLSIKPGEEIIFTLDESRYPSLVKFVETRQSISTINKVKIEMRFIVFADGIGWSSGDFIRQDPSDPRRWKPIDTTSPR